MSHHKRYADGDATAESLSLIASKLGEMDDRNDRRFEALERGQRQIADTMNANHLDLNAKLNLILSKLG